MRGVIQAKFIVIYSGLIPISVRICIYRGMKIMASYMYPLLEYVRTNGEAALAAVAVWLLFQEASEGCLLICCCGWIGELI